jgi:hypothetical protein
MRLAFRPAINRLLGLPLLLALTGLGNPAFRAAAQTADPAAPTLFVAPAVPSDWTAARANGIDLSLPPGLRVLQDHRTDHVWGQADEASKSGFAIRVAFSDTPEREMKRDGAVASGGLILPNGQTFRRYAADAPADAGMTARMQVLVSDLPMLGDERLIVGLMAMNRDIGPYRPMFDQVLAGMVLPPPGGQLQRDLLDGVVRLPIGPGWSGGNDLDADNVYLFTDDLPGRIRIDRGPVKTGGMRNGTPGTPVLFLGQKAQVFAHEDGSETVADATGDTGQARLIVLETCLPGGAAITFRLSGMPALFHDPAVAAMVSGGAIVMPPDARPCAPGTLPAGAQTGPSGARPDIAPPFGVAAPGLVQKRATGTALGGLYSYALPIGWSATRDAADLRIRFARADGGAAIVLARGAGLMAADGPAALVPRGTFHRPEITLGWPSIQYEWDGAGDPAGFQRLFVHAHCLPGDERFGMLVSASRAFQDQGDLARVLRDVTLHMPDAIVPCTDPAQGIGVATPAPAGTAPGPATGTDRPEPAGDDDWFGQAPLSALPSPATESLAGRSVATVTATSSSPSQAQAQAQANPPAASNPVSPPPPPAPPAPPAQPEDRDRFLPIEGGYATYHNDRYGTFISFPSGYFLPDPPPGNGDGRTFLSVDRTARFVVFAGYNALAMSDAALMNADKTGGGFDRVTYERRGTGWYVLSGFSGSDIVYRKVITNGLDGLIHTFEIRYPQSRKAEFDAMVSYMAKSFGPASIR